jgi:hypothetical protein
VTGSLAKPGEGEVVDGFVADDDASGGRASVTDEADRPADFGVGVAGTGGSGAARAVCDDARPDSLRDGAGIGWAVVVAAASLSPAGTGLRVVAAGAVERGAATVSAGRVTVPLSEKFCRSRGPTTSPGGSAVVAASCASSGAGASASPTAKTAAIKRKTALINSRFLLVNRATCAREPMPTNPPPFKHCIDEWDRNRPIRGLRASSDCGNRDASHRFQGGSSHKKLTTNRAFL